MEIVVEKYSVVGVCAQKLTGLLDIVSDVDKVALEACSKPAVPSLVVVQQKNANWVTLSAYLANAKFGQ
jgi:hypothetical protein